METCEVTEGTNTLLWPLIQVNERFRLARVHQSACRLPCGSVQGQVRPVLRVVGASGILCVSIDQASTGVVSASPCCSTEWVISSGSEFYSSVMCNDKTSTFCVVQDYSKRYFLIQKTGGYSKLFLRS